MSRVKNKNTSLEVNFSKELWRRGFRFRKHPNYFGKPDLALKKNKIVIFIDSCFWHGCKKHLRMPSSNIDYWNTKILRNIERDKEVNSYYKSLKWKIIRVWEHQLKDNKERISISI